MAGVRKTIDVCGARTHNLKNLTLSIPRDALVVITGPSGSGKSSLAFDTLYVEGQRRYVESLSTYARQFLEQWQKPDVERIDGLPPTVAIEQHTGSANPRSTVATTTEIYDYLRTLFARTGTPHCWRCQRPVQRQSVAEIVDATLARARDTAVMVLAPLVRGSRGRHASVLDALRREGLVRVRIDGRVERLDEDPQISGSRAHRLEAVVDRLTLQGEVQSRLADSLEYALQLGGGTVLVSAQRGDSWEDAFYSSEPACPIHPEVRFAELSPRLFSFNSPYGACSDCDGLGTVLEFDADLVIPDANLSLQQGAVEPWSAGQKRPGKPALRVVDEFCTKFGVQDEVPLRNLTADLRRILLHGTIAQDEEALGASFEGVIPSLRRRWQATTSESLKHRLHAYLSESPCRACHGARLGPAARAVQIDGQSIDAVVRLNIAALLAWCRSLSFEGERLLIAQPVVAAISKRLEFLTQVGLGYLTLDRRSATLSGGEAQRIRLATQVGSGLVGVCYILDEPTIGLHPRDSSRLLKTLKQLRDLGNTVIVVEHDEAMIRAAEHVIDIGPGAGQDGGEIMAQGKLDAVLNSARSLTGQYLSGSRRIEPPELRRVPDSSRWVEIRGASAHNLKNIDVRIPLGVLSCVTGVSGSGKSTLVNHILVRALRRKLDRTGDKPGEFERLSGSHHVHKIVEIDQSPIGRSPRSNPATYVGVFDLIRQVYARTREAKIRGYAASRFSFNVKGGRCEACQGHGTRRIEMHFLPPVFVTCDACKGTRYNRQTLDIRYRGRHIAEVLDLRVSEARRFFDSFARIGQRLALLADVGMGYITLGQASNTLSGGEAQRVKLAAELGREESDHTLYVLDEPTTGLHFADIDKLLAVLNRLVEQGHTVLVIEHNPDVIKTADWVIDLGPEGGDGGGHLVAAGTPEEIARHDESHTGQFLKSYLAEAAASG